VYAISRIEVRPGIWYWAVVIPSAPKAVLQGFYDVRRGGSNKALAAAIAWRDQQLAKAAVLTTTRPARRASSS
jgi:hypothetical protein